MIFFLGMWSSPLFYTHPTPATEILHTPHSTSNLAPYRSCRACFMLAHQMAAQLHNWWGCTIASNPKYTTGGVVETVGWYWCWDCGDDDWQSEDWFL